MASSTNDSAQEIFYRGPPKEIDNNDLLSNDIKVFQNNVKNKQNFDRNEYTGRVLKDNIELNKDYTVLNKEMLDYIWDELGYICNQKIIR